jgi:hypothetical protein
MGILDKVYHFMFKETNKQESSGFDLKELKENLRKAKEKKSEKKKPIDQKCNEKQQRTDEGNPTIIREIKWVPDSLKTCGVRQNPDRTILKLNNPLLLGVKLFFADISYITKGNYDIDRNNCFKFSKDVQDDATNCGIRCGVVMIRFHKCPTGHAIVAFETDYGLKFFEPQTANEEDMVIGHRYTAYLLGVQDDDVITQAEIFWNDGTHTIME